MIRHLQWIGPKRPVVEGRAQIAESLPLGSSDMQTPDQAAVLALVDAVEDVQRRTEARDLLELMSSTTGQAPKVWGSATIGFGQYHYRYETGQEGDFFTVGFSPIA